uniref:Uncharacterized membrane protein YckC, RDD family n=1 Tax=Candidatus Kentrum sp. DK TaxID=2126562 RepID=A0A450STD3_9GAMM|nr:MAG: Uncharacterized membrane protein YckC, RDD family [Candidatus Kentron sp. DK]
MQPMSCSVPNLPPAGAFRRFAAIFYDGLVLFAVLVFAHFPFQLLFGATATLPGSPWHPVYQAYLLGACFLYLGWCWTHGGQTLGMRAWRLALRERSGAAVSWKRALQRFLSAIVSWAALGLGFVWIFVDRERMAWHDRLSGTVVFRTDAPRKDTDQGHHHAN